MARCKRCSKQDCECDLLAEQINYDHSVLKTTVFTALQNAVDNGYFSNEDGYGNELGYANIAEELIQLDSEVERLVGLQMAMPGEPAHDEYVKLIAEMVREWKNTRN